MTRSVGGWEPCEAADATRGPASAVSAWGGAGWAAAGAAWSANCGPVGDGAAGGVRPGWSHSHRAHEHPARPGSAGGVVFGFARSPQHDFAAQQPASGVAQHDFAGATTCGAWAATWPAGRVRGQPQPRATAGAVPTAVETASSTQTSGRTVRTLSMAPCYTPGPRGVNRLWNRPRRAARGMMAPARGRRGRGPTPHDRPDGGARDARFDLPDRPAPAGARRPGAARRAVRAVPGRDGPVRRLPVL